MHKALNHIHFKCKGTVAILGDFNGRRIEWCEISNQQGNHLVQWATERGWVIDAPHIPTKTSSSDATTIDLAVTRNCKVHSFRYAKKFCLGISDHLPIVAYLDKSPTQAPAKPKISLLRRTKQNILDQVGTALEAALSQYLERLPHIQTEEDMEHLYKEFLDVQVEPFIPKGKKKGRERNKFFWTPQLSLKAQERNDLYKAATLSQDDEDWLRHACRGCARLGRDAQLEQLWRAQAN